MKSRLAPAKINLALHVTGQRHDGYHLLDTLVTFADPAFPAACDEVRMEVADTDSLIISGPEGEGLEAGPDNLVLRAVQALREHGHDVPPVRMELVKNLPVASGIGGGSADAAAALHLANDLLRKPLHLFDLLDVGLTLGADVPMCLFGLPTWAEGIGDDLSLGTKLPAFHMVLVNPRIPVSTPTVFRALESKENRVFWPQPIQLEDALVWLQEHTNHLEAPARRLLPVIDDVLFALQKTKDVELARMSGSGATCFGLYPTQGDARRAAESLASEYHHWWITALRTLPHNPPLPDFAS
ncbi:MAG: 4-(cytidine 5'-diphospho)-2-C-methyl-D-erythritol kinase [Pseudomonadota bacterium]